MVEQLQYLCMFKFMYLSYIMIFFISRSLCFLLCLGKIVGTESWGTFVVQTKPYCKNMKKQ